MRARNIKPGFFKNEELADCDPLARILFAGLWCMADKAGRLEDRPKRIKAEVLPYDDCDVDALLDQLQRRDFIVRYSANGAKYLTIPRFCAHQHQHMREPESTIPAPCPYSADTEAAPDKHSACTDLAPDEHLPGTEPARLKTENLKLKTENRKRNPPQPPQEGGALSGNAANGGERSEQAPSQDGIESAESIPYQQVVAYLNEKTGKHFPATSKTTRSHIKARWKEGYRIPDFQRVIDIKVEKWGNDPRMMDFLRPSTLFGTKFGEYLNESTRSPPGMAGLSEAGQVSARNIATWLESKKRGTTDARHGTICQEHDVSG